MSPEPPGLRTDQAHSARVYDYLLGGKDNYAVDRDLAESIEAAFPGVRLAARANRAFMTRAARRLAGLGVRQFLDIGTGIPTQPNLHQVVQDVVPDAHIVYVDNDPMVLAHAAALMISDPRGRTGYVQADARDPASILGAPVLRETLDLTRPVALSLITLLHFLDDDEAVGLVRATLDAVPADSYLMLSHGTFDFDAPSLKALVARYAAAGVQIHGRSSRQIEELFLGGLEPVDPGIVVAHRWHADPGPGFADIPDEDVSVYAVVARKP